MEIIKTIILALGLVEGAFIWKEMRHRNDMLKNDISLLKLKEREEKEERGRREIEGKFSNPLGDTYRNHRGLYAPVKPYSKMIDGDEEDEV